MQTNTVPHSVPHARYRSYHGHEIKFSLSTCPFVCTSHSWQTSVVLWLQMINEPSWLPLSHFLTEINHRAKCDISHRYHKNKRPSWHIIFVSCTHWVCPSIIHDFRLTAIKNKFCHRFEHFMQDNIQLRLNNLFGMLRCQDVRLNWVTRQINSCLDLANRHDRLHFGTGPITAYCLSKPRVTPSGGRCEGLYVCVVWEQLSCVLKSLKKKKGSPLTFPLSDTDTFLQWKSKLCLYWSM